MANVKVRLKDASNNVLHPETDWSVVQNKPSITVNQTSYAEIWHFGGHMEIESGQDLILKSPGSGIKVADRNTSGATKTLDDYPINWSAINGKPDYITADVREITFGYYSTITHDQEGSGYSGMIYPAIRTIDYTGNPGGDRYWYTCYYFNGTSWVKFSDSSKFSPGF